MTQDKKTTLKNVFLGLLAWIVFVVVFVGAIYLYNVADPVAIRPDVIGGYWGGYYGTATERVWILAKFEQAASRDKPLLLFVANRSGVMSFVGDRIDGRELISYELVGTDEPATSVHAKQLYYNRRYIYQFLLAGRFTDFWTRNTDTSIRGELVGENGSGEFGIERVSDKKALEFYDSFIKNAGDVSIKSLNDIFGSQ